MQIHHINQVHNAIHDNKLQLESDIDSNASSSCDHIDGWLGDDESVTDGTLNRKQKVKKAKGLPENPKIVPNYIDRGLGPKNVLPKTIY